VSSVANSVWDCEDKHDESLATGDSQQGLTMLLVLTFLFVYLQQPVACRDQEAKVQDHKQPLWKSAEAYICFF